MKFKFYTHGWKSDKYPLSIDRLDLLETGSIEMVEEIESAKSMMKEFHSDSEPIEEDDAIEIYEVTVTKVKEIPAKDIV